MIDFVVEATSHQLVRAALIVPVAGLVACWAFGYNPCTPASDAVDSGVPPPVHIRGGDADAGVCVCACVCAEPAAHAPAAVSSPPSRTGTYSADAVELARICASEADLVVTDDCAAILAVLRRRGARAGVSWSAVARRYSDRVYDLDRTDPRAWVAHIADAPQPPRGWPERVSWAAGRMRFRALLEAAERALRGESAPACEADHWGAPDGEDLARAERYGWVRVACGDARNAFWSVEKEEER